MERVDQYLAVANSYLESGEYSNAIVAAQDVLQDVVNRFGKHSLETAQLPYFFAKVGFECYKAVVERGIKSPFPDKRTLLSYASGHGVVLIGMLDDFGLNESLLYLQGCLLLANIVLLDETNYIPKGGEWPQDVDREGMINFAKNVLYKGFKVGWGMLEKGQWDKANVSKATEDLRVTLLKLIPRSKVKERHWHFDGVGFIKTLVDEQSGKIYFDAQSICDALGVSLEEAEKIVDDKDKLDLNQFEIVDEKS